MDIKSTLLGVFSESPFKLIDEHMQVSVSASRLLNDLIKSVLEGDWDKARSVQKEISRFESSADRLQREVNRRLHQEMFLPVSRYDVLSLVKSQDSIANQSEDIAGFLLGRQMVFPKSIHVNMIDFVRSSVSVCDQSAEIVSRLGLVMQSGFKGPCMDETEKMALKIHDLEHQNDLLQVKLRHLLWKEEAHLEPVDTMFMYRIIERIGNLADHAHHIGEKFTLMLVSL